MVQPAQRDHPLHGAEAPWEPTHVAPCEMCDDGNAVPTRMGLCHSCYAAMDQPLGDEQEA